MTKEFKDNIKKELTKSLSPEKEIAEIILIKKIIYLNAEAQRSQSLLGNLL